MTEKTRVLFAARIWRMGKTVVFPLTKLLMEAVGARPDDLIICRVHPPYVTFRVAKPEAAIPVEGFGSEELPPSWIGKQDNTRDGVA